MEWLVRAAGPATTSGYWLYTGGVGYGWTNPAAGRLWVGYWLAYGACAAATVCVYTKVTSSLSPTIFPGNISTALPVKLCKFGLNSNRTSAMSSYSSKAGLDAIREWSSSVKPIRLLE